eukprot:COSAG06_NODE_439_length_15765_cov_69.583812_2_plen_186_part_00
MRCAEIGANPDRTCKMVRSPAQRPLSFSGGVFFYLLCNDPWDLSAPHLYISCTARQRNFAVQLSPQVSSPALQYCVRELRRSAGQEPGQQLSHKCLQCDCGVGREFSVFSQNLQNRVKTSKFPHAPTYTHTHTPPGPQADSRPHNHIVVAQPACSAARGSRARTEIARPVVTAGAAEAAVVAWPL